MADPSRSSRRAVAVLLIVGVGAVEVQSIAQILTSQSRLRDRIVTTARISLLQSYAQIKGVVANGDLSAQRNGLATALAMTGAAEGELFDPRGRLLMAIPPPAGVVKIAPIADAASLEEGQILVVGPVIGPPSRVLSYAVFPMTPDRVLLRLSTPIPDLVADLRERERNLAGHGVALLALVLAAALLLAPSRSDPAPAFPRALDAYAEAMGRLSERERAISAEHVAERERLQSSLRDRDAMARAGELTSGIVHEVRNGLGTILGYARLLEKTIESPTALEEIGSIREECETLEGVIRRFTDFIKTESLHVSPFELRRMLSRVVSRECKSRPGPVVHLPEGDWGTLQGDEELLERSFENLVRNARDAAGPGGAVSIAFERVPGGTMTRVSDDGPGFKASDREARRPFFTTKARGLGLGLPMARKIVELHQGEITFVDHSPRGLTVQVFLPTDPAPAKNVTDRTAGEAGSRG